VNQPQPERLTLSLADIDEAYRRIHAIERRLKNDDLSLFLVLLLQSIATHPDAPIGNNALVLGVTPSAISNGMDRLERRGLVQRLNRTDDASPDRRQVLARITERGQAMLDGLATIEVELK
jgi:DNA-binding MarR family transcriptional regulator